MKIPSRSRLCCQDQTPIGPGMRYLSVLTDEGQRQDYCQMCADKQTPSGAHWWASVPIKPKKVLTLDEKLIEQLRLLSQKKSPLAFLLAMYMQRLGLIARRSKQIFEIEASGETFHLPTPAMMPEAEDGEKLKELIGLSS
jgi:hypothetical protein